MAAANTEKVRAVGRVCGLFAGIGGLELGLGAAGYHATLLSEIDPHAGAVLRARFPEATLVEDVQDIAALPDVDVVTAGFPCQDLSMAGPKVGIGGARSGLVDTLFGLLKRAKRKPRWLVVENVPYMLSLSRGQAMTHLVERLADLGYAWAYRVVDARAFGVPQRRLRVILVASPTEDPRGVLFADDAEEQVDDRVGPVDPARAYGFYWTEGKRGLGWTVDGVPTVKGGSTIGIPSPPAIWLPDEGRIGTPDIHDAERLQGFEAGWTAPAREVARGERMRWRLVGNAVCVPVAKWVGRRLASPGTMAARRSVWSGGKWPRAAWGDGKRIEEVHVSRWPVQEEYAGLRSFLTKPLVPLSERATRGYLNRTGQSRHLRFADGFLDAVRAHLAEMTARNLSAG